MKISEKLSHKFQWKSECGCFSVFLDPHQHFQFHFTVPMKNLKKLGQNKIIIHHRYYTQCTSLIEKKLSYIYFERKINDKVKNFKLNNSLDWTEPAPNWLNPIQNWPNLKPIWIKINSIENNPSKNHQTNRFNGSYLKFHIYHIKRNWIDEIVSNLLPGNGEYVEDLGFEISCMFEVWIEVITPFSFH